jgi:TM2 domain-containing membrane protein YozV
MSVEKISVQGEGKNTIIAYVLWWFLGSLGIHRMYLGRTGSGVTQLLLLIFGIVTWFFGIGLLLLAILGVWWLVDAFLTYGMVREENEKRGLGASAVIFSKSNDNDSSDLDQLEKLYNLREKGALTEEEYRDRKSKIN